MEAGDFGKASSQAAKGVVLRNSWPSALKLLKGMDGPAPPHNQHSSTTVSLPFGSVSLRNEVQPFFFFSFFLFAMDMLKLKIKSMCFSVGF